MLRFGDHPLDIEVAALVTKAAKQFEKLGCTVEEVAAALPHADAGRAFVDALAAAPAAPAASSIPRAGTASSIPNLLASAKAGLRYSLQDVVNAQVTRRELAIAWNLFFDKYDLLLTPDGRRAALRGAARTCPTGPTARPTRCGRPTPRTFNLSRHPAASVPCGLSRDGLPIGLQIAAGHFKARSCCAPRRAMPRPIR